uniref:Ubiquitin-like protein ATG12 n=2 Tax=Sordaria macrospora TaxID=5147 RepID=ATG12_SORMK|nr:RecName: Full=Ubiquitin-like protein ATG12; AltName: Full=Autophagy-related protein 12 [Sordaria macrospora k-hell]
MASPQPPFGGGSNSNSNTASPSNNLSPTASPLLEGRDSPNLPLTMTASTVLMTLPRDATAALAEAGKFGQEKVVIRFKPVGSAPALRREQVKVSSTERFDTVMTYIRKTLKCRESDSVFLYVNSVFAPALDEVVGNLWRCFKDSTNQLNVSYSMTPSFG